MSEPRCWCGSAALSAFSADYAWCVACGTLVGTREADPSARGVADDDRDFYGRRYYDTHLVERHGYPTIEVRARDDLAGRCVHWIGALASRCPPPARILEIGAAHGAFVALLRQAGYRAYGLELSPTVVAFARRTFGVRMLVGPLERHHIRPASLDVVALLDVIEHLPAPAETLRQAMGLLRPGGLLLIQTPEFPEASHDSLAASGSRFLDQLKPEEHVFLFSRRSIRELLARAGAPWVAFEPAYFAHYDMFLVAGREEPPAVAPDRVTAALERTPSARVVQAMLAIERARIEADAATAAARADTAHLEGLLARCEEDREGRRLVILEQGRQIVDITHLRARLEAAERDLSDAREQQAAASGDRDGAREALAAALAESARLAAAAGAAASERDAIAAQLDAERQHAFDLIGQLAAAEADRDQLNEALAVARQETAGLARQIARVAAERDEVSAELSAVRGDLGRASEWLAAAHAREAALEAERACLVAERDDLDRRRMDLEQRCQLLTDQRGALTRRTAALETEAAALRDLVAERDAHLATLAARADAFEDRAGALSADLARAGRNQARLLETIARLRLLVERSAGAHQTLRTSRAYRLLRGLGRWAAYDRVTADLLGTPVPLPDRLEPVSGLSPAGAPPPAPGPVTPPLPAAPPLDPFPPELDTEAGSGAEPPPAAVAPARSEAAGGLTDPDILAEAVARLNLWDPALFDRFERRGIHVTPDHFYSPVPNVVALAAAPWPAPSAMVGVDLRDAAQLEWLEACREYRGELAAWPTAPTGVPHEYHRENPMFRVVDADILHCLVRRLRPRRVIEVGSGFSTLVTAAALRRNAAEDHPGELVAVEPFPGDVLRAGVPGLDQLRVEGVQSLPDGFFDVLGRDDLLFIDSSHVVKTGSDVTRLFLEVLPRIRPGVYVHVHDVFLPAEYPREWVVGEHRFWSEQYLLHAFLLFNGTFEVVWAGSYMHLRHPERLREVFPAYDPDRAWPGSFWMRRRDT